MAGILIIKREEDADTHRGMTTGGHRNKTAIYKAKTEASGETSPADTLISDSSLQHCEKTHFCWLSPSACSIL